MIEEKKRNTFSGSLGFILASAGSAVGLGNIWRFPYLAAKDGGGLFLIVYVIFALTFGFTLLITEIAIGRKTKQSTLIAYSRIRPKWGFLGLFAFVIPNIIFPYYCVIGGWVIKYMSMYFAFQGNFAANNAFFSSFISSSTQVIFYSSIFIFLCFLVVFKGVQKGIEKFSKYLMPCLAIMIVGLAIYSFFIKHTDENGVMRTGLQGVAVYITPNFEGLTIKKFLTICLDAIGQLFYSLSVAMGIMVVYGSYMKDEDNLVKSVNYIEIFDVAIAMLAGLMIIPAVYVFNGVEGMSSGPGLMFISLPKIFTSLGSAGEVVGLLFFIMVFFAALTSGVSLFEAIVSSVIDITGWARNKVCCIMGAISLVIAVFISLGYSVFYFELTLPNGTKGQLLDLFDYVSNNILMPILALLTCLLVGWGVKTSTITDEITKNNEKFARKNLYVVMVKFITPLLLFVLLLFSLGIFGR